MKQKTKLVASAVFLILMTPLAVMGIIEKIEKLQEPEIVLKNPKIGDIKLMALAKTEFFKVCPKALDYWDDLEVTTATVFRPGYHSMAEKAKWPVQIDFSLKVKNTTNLKMPRKFNANGHTLHFKMGGGNRPGIIIQKAQSAKFCGVKPAGEGNDTFIDWPEFKGLI